MANTYYLCGGISFIKAEQNNSLQQYSQAKDYLTKTVELKPDFARAYLLLAKANLALGDSESANANMALKYATEQQVADEARSLLQNN
jgi:predicted Zn-dependent protease